MLVDSIEVRPKSNRQRSTKQAGELRIWNLGSTVYIPELGETLPAGAGAASIVTLLLRVALKIRAGGSLVVRGLMG
jgi:hypothetical protein